MKPSTSKNGANHRVFERPNIAALTRPVLDPNTAAGRAEAQRIVRRALLKGWLTPKPFGRVGEDFERSHHRKPDLVGQSTGAEKQHRNRTGEVAPIEPPAPACAGSGR